MQEIAVSCARLQRNASRTEIEYSIYIQLIESSIELSADYHCYEKLKASLTNCIWFEFNEDKGSKSEKLSVISN